MLSTTAVAATALVATLAAPAVAHGRLGPTAPAHTRGVPDPTDPASYDFSDCPTLPPSLEAATWRCEVHLATAELTVGPNRISGIPMRLVHAEGQMPDGSTGQIFGTLQSPPTVVPVDRIRGHRVTVQVRYAGYADLIGNGPDPGGLYLMLAVRGSGLGDHCTIGTLANPIRTHASRVGATTTIPTDPPIRQFTLQDTSFAVPAASGCHGNDRRVDALFGLPAVSGNVLTLQAAYTYRMY